MSNDVLRLGEVSHTSLGAVASGAHVRSGQSVIF